MSGKKVKRQPESYVRSAVKQFLVLGGWFVFPIVQSALSYKGIADLVAVKDGRTVYVEIKCAKGRQSEAQLEFERQIQAHGAEYILARSVDDVSHLCATLLDR